MVEGHVGEPTLEAGSALDRLAALAEVVVDDEYAFVRPAVLDGAMDQGILAGRGFLVFEDLLRSRLTARDDRRAIQMRMADVWLLPTARMTAMPPMSLRSFT